MKVFYRFLWVLAGLDILLAIKDSTTGRWGFAIFFFLGSITLTILGFILREQST